MCPVLQDVLIYRQMDRWTYIDQQTDEQTEGWTDHLTGGLSYRCKDVPINFFASFWVVLAAGKNALWNNGPMDYRTINQWTDKVF